MSKSKIRIAKRKSLQRFGLEQSELHKNIIYIIQNNKGELLDRISNSQNKWIVNINNRNYTVIYDNKNKILLSCTELKFT